MNALRLLTTTHLTKLSLPGVRASAWNGIAPAGCRIEAPVVQAICLCARANFAQAASPHVIAVLASARFHVELPLVLTVDLVQSAVLTKVTLPRQRAVLTHAQQRIPLPTVHAVCFFAQAILTEVAAPGPLAVLAPTRVHWVEHAAVPALGRFTHTQIAFLSTPWMIALLACTELSVKRTIVTTIGFGFGASVAKFTSPRVIAVVAGTRHQIHDRSVLAVVRDLRAVRVLLAISVIIIVFCCWQVVNDCFVNPGINVMLHHEVIRCDLVDELVVLVTISQILDQFENFFRRLVVLFRLWALKRLGRVTLAERLVAHLTLHKGAALCQKVVALLVAR